MKISENIKKILIVLSVVIASILLIYYAGPLCIRLVVYLFGLLSPFIFGYFVAKVINPVADRLQRRLHVPRGISVVTVIALTIVIVFGIFALLGYKLVDEVINLIRNWPQIFDSLRSNWNEISGNLSEMYITMPQFVQSVVDTAWADIYKEGVAITREIPVVDMAQVVAKSLPSGLIWTVMFILSLYFMVSLGWSLTEFVGKTFGEKAGDKLREIKKQCKTYLGGYVKAQIILMGIVFVVIFIILSLFDAPFALIVALLTAFLDALPFLGSGIVLWPMAVIYLIDSNVKLCVVYVITYFIIMILRRFLEPKLVSDRMGFNPIWTLIAMFVGYKLWGITGFIAGPLLLMLIFSLYAVGLFKYPAMVIKQLARFTVKEVKLFAEYLGEITK